jgi:hypothetical protein
MNTRHPTAVRFLLGSALVLTLTFAWPHTSSAASATWTGNVDGDWTNDGNWTAAHPNGLNDIATFNNTLGNPVVTIGAVPQTIKQIILQGNSLASYTIGGGTFLVPSIGSYNLVERQNTVLANQIINADFELSATSSNNPLIRNNSDTGRLIINGNFVSTGASIRNMTLNGSNSNVTEFNGNFTATTGGISMQVQNGTGIFNGVGTFTNLSTASAARLVLNGTSSSVAQVVINNTSTFGGIGALTANLQLAPSSTGTIVAPGDFTLLSGQQTGTLSVSGNLSYNTNNAPGSFQFQIGGNTPGDGQGFYDQLNVSGSISFAGFGGNSATSLTLSLVNNYTPVPGDIFYLVNRGDVGAYSRFFTNFSEGQIFDLGPASAEFTYAANWTGTQAGSSFTGGNDIAIRMVPEPASVSLLAAGVLAFGLSRRRSNRQSW